MAAREFISYMRALGYSRDDLRTVGENEFFYSVPISVDAPQHLPFVHFENANDLYEAHRRYWNDNELNAFVAVGRDKSYVINARVKPDVRQEIPSGSVLSSFNYGVNSPGFEGLELTKISKLNVDSAFFFEMVIKSRNQRREQSVDKDLLLNLISLRHDLLAINEDQEIVHLLILRCLFIKYLEDKGIYEQGFLSNVLSTRSPKRLCDAFNEIKKINGDIFKITGDAVSRRIDAEYLSSLFRFFTCDYRSGQGWIFPYMFDRIPIQLISTVYESFLRTDEKQGKGVYYTPTFLVDFVLRHSLLDAVRVNPNLTILDPAVGSAAFLVESFKIIVEEKEKQKSRRLSYEQKKRILTKQLFGIDVDPYALEIATFSLYLALIETEDPNFIRHQIEHSHPILPPLIGSNLICANALVDPVFENRSFDYVVSNPPWGSAKRGSDKESERERVAMGTEGRTGENSLFGNVADYERSQAFFLAVQCWGHAETRFALVTKNSLFLNRTARDLRRELLERYDFDWIYELSEYNSILFKKECIGEVAGEKIQLGASEPCAVSVFRFRTNSDHKVNFVSPKLTEFAKAFRIIHSGDRIQRLKQTKFLEEDRLWHVLLNGDLEDFALMERISLLPAHYTAKCNAGLIPDKSMRPLGPPDIRPLIEPEHFVRYHQVAEPAPFNYNRSMERRRRPEQFEGSRLLFPNRPLKSHGFRLSCILVDGPVLHKDNIFSIRVTELLDKPVTNYLPFLALFNSKLIGYLIYQASAQWDTGVGKREKLRTWDIEELPIPEIPREKQQKLSAAVEGIFAANFESEVLLLERKIDSIVFDIYGLSSYEREVVNEFFEINVERENPFVKETDISKYASSFISTFNMMLSDGHTLEMSDYSISGELGTAVCFSLSGTDIGASKNESLDTRSILNFVKRKQLASVDLSRLLNEEKVRLYDEHALCLVKSNLFRDWTKRRAIIDAREELGLALSKLPTTND